MRKTIRTAAIAASTLALLAPAAFAQGGPPAGSGGGGAGGGGGAPTPAGSCAKITRLANSVGYYSIWAAIWSHYAISSSCRDATWQMTFTNDSTGTVDYTRTGVATIGTTSGIVDEDWAAKSASYTVTLTVSDPTGAVLASQSTAAVTGA